MNTTGTNAGHNHGRISKCPVLLAFCHENDGHPSASKLFPPEPKNMNKAILVACLAVAMSTSAALAAKHHAKKPDAAPAMTAPAPTQLFVVSDADKALYAKNKRESGVK
jgi:hypothetical protein